MISSWLPIDPVLGCKYLGQGLSVAGELGVTQDPGDGFEESVGTLVTLLVLVTHQLSDLQ